MFKPYHCLGDLNPDLASFRFAFPTFIGDGHKDAACKGVRRHTAVCSAPLVQQRHNSQLGTGTGSLDMEDSRLL